MADTSLFSPESALIGPSGAAPSFLDPTAIDRNIRALSAVESVSRMPNLPDAVKLDLASTPGASEESLIDLLTGIDHDLNDEDEDEPSQLLLPGRSQPGTSGIQQAQIILAGLSNNPPPTQITPDAVRMTKRRMVEDGYLDMDAQRLDDSWSPELNRIRNEMAFDDYNRSLRGNRVGAVPIGNDERGVMKLLNDFTSPSGLLAAATELDFLPDFGAISREFSTWGDKWREIGKSENPFDFVGNVFDALTGPIDDIVFPIINTGLLFTGFGAIANSARVGWQGSRLIRAGNLFDRLYGSSRLGRFLASPTRLAGNLDELGRASWTATKLQGTEHFAALGRGMEAWRAYRPVRATKSVVQQGMRLGFAQEAESRFGSFQGGTSLQDLGIGQGPADFLEQAKFSPLAAPFEVLLAPYNIFTPGTFVRRAGEGLGTFGRLGGLAARQLGTVGGRAAIGAGVGIAGGTVLGEDAGDIVEGVAIGAGLGAAAPVIGRGIQNRAVASGLKGAVVGGAAGAFLGEDPEDIAIGALAGAGFFNVTDTARARFLGQLDGTAFNRAIRGLGGKMVATSFLPLAESQEVSLAFDRGMRWRLRDDPQALADWADDVNRGGVTQALQRIQGGDAEMAASTVSFVFASSAIDWIATAQANTIMGKGWRGRYHAARNKLINQLRSYDTSQFTEGMLDDLATSIAFTERGGGPLAAVYKRRNQIRQELGSSPERALELANKHNMMAAETVKQLLNPANFPKLDDSTFAQIPLADRVAVGLGQDFAAQTLEGRGWIMQKYMDQVFDSLGRFPEFVGATDGIRKARMSGLFDGAKLKGFTDRFGNQKSVYRLGALANDEAAALNSAATDQLLRLDPAALGQVNVTPLASAHAPGAMTVGLKGTKFKQDLEMLAEQVRDLRDVRKRLQRLGNPTDWRRGVASVGGLDENAKLTDLTAKQIEAIVGAIDPVVGSKKATKHLLGFAQRHNLSLAELDQAVVKAADDLANNSQVWKDHGFDDLVYGDDGKALFGFDALDARLTELNEAIPFRAAQVDTDDLVRYLRESGNDMGADEITQLVKGLDDDGYQLVHGVEFLMPEDLAHGNIFQDITRRHLNAATFGNMFKGKLPVERLLLEDRRHRLAVSHALSEAGLGDFGPEDAKIGRIIGGLNDLLKDMQRPTMDLLREYHLENAAQRLGTRLKSASAPIRVDDLSRHKNKVIDYMMTNLDLTQQEASAVWQATHKFRSTDWQEVGLYGLESKLRSTNVVEWGLKTLTGSKYGKGLKNSALGVVEAEIGAASLGAAAGAAGAQIADPDMSFEDRLAAIAGGAMAGATGRAITLGGSKVLNQAARILPGKGTLVDRAAHWRYGYLPDFMAQWRDSLRFTLSPMFDLSRYTEGMFLAQTAAPLRNADGSRFTMPLNMSPHGLRRTLRKEGMTAKQAQAKYQGWIDQFNHFAKSKGDFDAEVMDSAGRWFKQLGILGFSPVDWMGTAFAQMVRRGLDPTQAYDAARQMYTYGTRGRSAAEMSVNFVFFPFSFQKKAIGHMAKWMNDDLGRSIIIHDALQTYQLLDQHYNLDERWKDHIPWIQQLNRLNLFAYGLSPGRFGGVNSQMLESGGKLAWNLFVPAGVEIKGVDSSAELQDVMRNLVPLRNDIDWMVKNLQESGNVMFSEEHVTSAAAVRRGYEEWYDFADSFTQELERKGYQLSDIYNKPWLEEARMLYEGKRAEVADRYPAWAEAKQEYQGKIMERQMERRLRLDRVQLAQTEGRAPSPDDAMFAQFEEMLEMFRQDLKAVTGSTDLQNAPPEVTKEILRLAAEFARQNPRWMQLWGTHYEHEFGPISVALTMAP